MTPGFLHPSAFPETCASMSRVSFGRGRVGEKGGKEDLGGGKAREILDIGLTLKMGGIWAWPIMSK